MPTFDKVYEAVSRIPKGKVATCGRTRAPLVGHCMLIVWVTLLGDRGSSLLNSFYSIFPLPGAMRHSSFGSSAFGTSRGPTRRSGCFGEGSLLTILLWVSSEKRGRFGVACGSGGCTPLLMPSFLSTLSTILLPPSDILTF